MAQVTFKLAKIESVQGEGRKEDLYTYVAGSQIACFRFHSKKAFVAVIHESTNVNKAVVSKLVDAQIEKGINQGDYKGGFKEAISELTVRHASLKAAPVAKAAPKKTAPAPKAKPMTINKTNFKNNVRALVEAIPGGKFERLTDSSDRNWVTYEGSKPVLVVYKILMNQLKALGFAAGTSVNTTLNDDMVITDFELSYGAKGSQYMIRVYSDAIPEFNEETDEETYRPVTVIDTYVK